MIRLQHVTEFEVHKFSVEASDLYDAVPELRNSWPKQLPTSIGNGQPFMRVAKKIDAEGDIIWVTYRQALGCIDLRIYND